MSSHALGMPSLLDIDGVELVNHRLRYTPQFQQPVEKLDDAVAQWIPAFAGMTIAERFHTFRQSREGGNPLLYPFSTSS